MLRPMVLSFVLLIIGLVLTNQAYGKDGRRDEPIGSDKPTDLNGESGVVATRPDDSRPRGDSNSGFKSRVDFNSGFTSGDDSNGGSRSRGDSNSGSRSRGDFNSGSRSRGDSNSGSRSRGDSSSGSGSRGDSNSSFRSGDDSNGGSRSRGDSNSGSRSGDDSNRALILDSNINSVLIRNPNTVRPASANYISDFSKDPRFNRNDGSFGNRLEERPIVPNEDRVEPHRLYERAPPYGSYFYGYKGYESPDAGYYGRRRYFANRFSNNGYYDYSKYPYRLYRRSDVGSSLNSSFYATNWNVE